MLLVIFSLFSVVVFCCFACTSFGLFSARGPRGKNIPSPSRTMRKAGWCIVQGSHRREKYLNSIEGFHEKYLKIQSVLKSTGKLLLRPLRFPEIYNFLKDYYTIGDLNQYKIVMPIFGAVSSPNKGLFTK